MFPRYEIRSSVVYVCPRKNITECATRFHKQVELLWVKSHKLDVTIDGEKYTLYPGDIYIVFPNITHSIDSAHAAGCVLIADDIFFSSYHDMLFHYKPKCPIVRRGDFPEIVYTLLERAEDIKRNDFERRGNVLVGYISAIIGELIDSVTLIDRSADNDLVQQLVMYLLDNYTEEITLDDVARDLSYNKYYISHIIADTFKCNFRALVNSYRISMAQNILLSTTKTISEIAYECGFKNQSSFNRIFLKHCGITPRDFRHSPEAVPERSPGYEIRG